MTRFGRKKSPRRALPRSDNETVQRLKDLVGLNFQNDSGKRTYREVFGLPPKETSAEASDDEDEDMDDNESEDITPRKAGGGVEH